VDRAAEAAADAVPAEVNRVVVADHRAEAVADSSAIRREAAVVVDIKGEADQAAAAPPIAAAAHSETPDLGTTAAGEATLVRRAEVVKLKTAIDLPEVTAALKAAAILPAVAAMHAGAVLPVHKPNVHATKLQPSGVENRKRIAAANRPEAAVQRMAV
jgi:hypothetical protein